MTNISLQLKQNTQVGETNLHIDRHLAAAVAASVAKLCTFLLDIIPVVNSSFALVIEALEDLCKV